MGSGTSSMALDSNAPRLMIHTDLTMSLSLAEVTLGLKPVLPPHDRELELRSLHLLSPISVYARVTQVLVELGRER